MGFMCSSAGASYYVWPVVCHTSILAHLSRKLKLSYCDQSLSVICRASMVHP